MHVVVSINWLRSRTREHGNNERGKEFTSNLSAKSTRDSPLTSFPVLFKLIADCSCVGWLDQQRFRLLVFERIWCVEIVRIIKSRIGIGINQLWLHTIDPLWKIITDTDQRVIAFEPGAARGRIRPC
ncbi:hypothetical protein C495_14527 [Natronorubrum sulfidifaciens JCM 14089]|uniref:Uncharacterized protein n=1 Tax=Natronorubrum sulfidifaciens JCM 14089 TaxID=1230460 RepID=L9VZN6_9EURY|nr:hypothetical protein C495_14527 [Natronorubrum sulfidifaciens JCM 14089]